MDAALAAFALAPGLALGSFLNVVAARVPLRRSLVRPRSACMSCAVAIAPYDNVPLVSYALLRGRCRSCHTRIPLTYPAVELATAILLAGCVLAFGLSARALVAAFFCAVLVAVSATDLAHRIIPNRIVLPATVIVLAARIAIQPGLEWPLAALGAALFFLLAALAYPGGMGMGDVKLALFLGAGLGWTVGVALMVGMLAALVPAAVLLWRHGARARKLAIPFGPFLALGGIVALFAGESLLDVYLGTF
ncbi:MAG: prepilin peptidase [Actinobacteria bacterium]|nr:prepilin peptidase [Actinomycetota bacterium]